MARHHDSPWVIFGLGQDGQKTKLVTGGKSASMRGFEVDVWEYDQPADERKFCHIRLVFTTLESLQDFREIVDRTLDLFRQYETIERMKLLLSEKGADQDDRCAAVDVVCRRIAGLLYWSCGACGGPLAYRDKYCSACGKAVKWDAAD